MKKYFLLVLLFLFILPLYSQSKYQITDVNYTIKGCGPKIMGQTKAYALENYEAVDKEIVFNSEDELKEYIKDYELRLNNLRNFETIVISYSYKLDENSNPDSIIPVTLNVQLKDSIHILGLPYPKYNSNEGFTLKLKIKDTNFMGTINEMNASFDLKLEQESEEQPIKPNFGFTFSYDYPFKVKKVNFKWINDYSFFYKVGNWSPEWNAKTGIEIKYKQKNINYVLDLYQSVNRDFDYSEYNDLTYFGEEVKFSLPIDIFEIKNVSTLQYTPYVDFVFNFDKNKININNSSLSSPYLTVGHSLAIKRVNWNKNLRDGINFEVGNYYKYNFQRKMFYTNFNLSLNVYKSFPLFNTDNFMNRFGLAGRIYAFIDIYDYTNIYFQNDGSKIGGYLRGARDYQKFAASEVSDWYSLQTPAAFCFSFDIPLHIFETHFSNETFFRYFNFDLQISPFIDFAVFYNKYTKSWFDLKDGVYTGGIEVLVYPAKWSSFTVRGSLGLDLSRTLLKKIVNTDWRENCALYEIDFGIGLKY